MLPSSIMAVSYHLSKTSGVYASQEQWTLRRHSGGQKEDLGVFGSKEIGTKVLKALRAGKITEAKAREMGKSFEASRRAHAAKAGHDAKQATVAEIDDNRFPLFVRMRPESEEDGVLLAARLRRRRFHKMKLMRVEGSGIDWECRVENPAELAELIDAIEGGTDTHVMMQSLDVAENFTGDRFEGAEARSERILSLLAAAPEKIRNIYRKTTAPADDDGPDLM